MPRLTLGLPVYNGARHLGASVESILGQTWGDFTLVVSDNASTDGTEDVCRGYARHDSRVRYVRQSTNIGANANYNFVAGGLDTELFRWAAHDDLLAPDYLRVCVNALDAQPEAVLGHCEPLLIDVDGAPLRQTAEGYVQPDGVPVHPPDAPLVERGLTDDSPSVRFAAVLLRTVWVFEIFGIVRTAALRHTGLQRPYYGTDKVLVSHLALLGPFAAVPHPLWSRRCHLGATNNLDALSRARWSNPGGRPLPTAVNVTLGYLEAVRRSPLSPVEQARCIQAIGRKAVGAPLGLIGAEFAAVARDRLRRRPPAA